MNPLRELEAQGQSVWLDYIHCSLIRSGELKRLVEEDGIRGVTSNPTIFEKAIAGSTAYDDALSVMLANDPNLDPQNLYEPLAIEDIRMAADVLRVVYDQTRGDDGYVSLEVSPRLAHDTEATISEAKRLKAAVDRPNVMIKVPATEAGIPAIEDLIAAGVNVNVTLMFSLSHYEAVAQAYLRGLRRCTNPSEVASVASFFVSRIDTAVDRVLEERAIPEAAALCGQIAISNAKVVYRRFLQIFYHEGFGSLQQKGARVQRPLWASTGTKNPRYSDVLYVENLIGPQTVNTLPPATIDAFRDHGRIPGATVKEGLAEADAALTHLQDLNISLDAITAKLQSDGVAAFASSFDQLMAALETKRRSLTRIKLNRLELQLGPYRRRVSRQLKNWEEQRFSVRLWNKDITLWSSEPLPELGDRLGWLELPETMENQVAGLRAFADRVKAESFHHLVLLGMGGSTLAPEVFQRTFGNAPGYPKLIVLDSTHPQAVKDVEAWIDLGRTLFLVSSKSGTTIETHSFFRYFWDRLTKLEPEPGAHFVAITDRQTPLERLAAERKFLATVTAPETVGGRYSALTVFGLVPAALIGIDIGSILARARRMSQGCSAPSPVANNPGLLLGAALGELALTKRDKVTFLSSPSLKAFPSWVEQLIAESTGKDRRGIIPVVDEGTGAPEKYGDDRVFVYFRLEGDENHVLDRQLAALEANGHPAIRIELDEKSDLGQEFFRWEVAIAAAGAALGIHPFNQPDVQLAKDLAKKAMEKNDGKKGGHRRDEVAVADHAAFEQAMAAWLGRKKARDYLAVQAYLNPSGKNTEALKTICSALRERLGLATTLGFGPRFLHSTGQLHKGGPNSALVLQIVDEPEDNLAVPGTGYTFDDLIRAQALGDFAALKQRRRRALRVNLGNHTEGGLQRLLESLRG
ncbi:MAG TPA: bifunctional transaldolase/phosoglucose isomerase [Terriglobales bacterium]|nr:bifunctional transaldolase/phosoglucose isomerase [Terriglobales bacterium]